MRARQLVIVLTIAGAIGTSLAHGEEPEEATVAGRHLAPDAVSSVSGAEIVSSRGLEPWIHHTMPDTMRSKIERAFAIAADRVRSREECSALFSPFGIDGVDLLTRSLYFPAGPGLQTTRCRHAFAVTEIGGPTIRVCRKVTAHSDERVAIALIHEALHHAGLCEYPHDRTAMLSGEINNQVMRNCDLH